MRASYLQPLQMWEWHPCFVVSWDMFQPIASRWRQHLPSNIFQNCFIVSEVVVAWHLCWPPNNLIYTVSTAAAQPTDYKSIGYIKTTHLILTTVSNWYNYNIPPTTPYMYMLLAASSGLISMSARIYGPHSCVLAGDYVACSCIGEYGRATIKLYSIRHECFGVCLCSTQLEQSKWIGGWVLKIGVLAHAERVYVKIVLFSLYRSYQCCEHRSLPLWQTLVTRYHL